MKNNIFIAALLILLSSLTTSLSAATLSDTAKEARWAEQVVPSLLDGEPVWLDDGQGHEFLGIYTPGDGDGERAVILMHGVGVHPNWPDVIYPLREALLENEITSLSIQMPILANEAADAEYAPLYEEAPGRVQAAIDYLRNSGYSKIDVVGHSAGARMAEYYLVQDGADDVNSAVLIGLGRSVGWPECIDALAQLRVPALDLYGSKDLDTVLDTVEDRAAAGKLSSAGVYDQIRVDGANHFYQGHEDELKNAVIEWLQSR